MTYSEKQYAPNTDGNPYRFNSFMTDAEWKEVARWYPFSLRSLLYDGQWFEIGRFALRNQAYEAMKALDKERPGKYYIIVQCTRVGKAGRERVVWFEGASEFIMLREREQRRQGKRESV